MTDRADELTMLGQGGLRFPQSPQEARLETFANRSPQRRYTVTISTAEFSSLCPVTGQPDYAALTISYQPAARCLETKSLKFYLASFRQQAEFNEDVVNRILTDLVSACEPHQMTVRGEFAARGGLQLTAEASHPDE